MRVLLATPTYDGKLCADYTSALAQEMLLTPPGTTISPLFLSHVALLGMARSWLATFAMVNEFDKLIFVDADVGWTPGDLKRLYMSPGRATAGLYCGKSIGDLQYIVDVGNELRAVEPALAEDNKPPAVAATMAALRRHNTPKGVPISAAATGFSCYDVGVFKELAQYVDQYENPLSTVIAGAVIPSMIYNFFQTDVLANGQFIGEDIYFAKLMAKHGIQQYLNLNCLTSHKGAHVYKNPVFSEEKKEAPPARPPPPGWRICKPCEPGNISASIIKQRVDNIWPTSESGNATTTTTANTPASGTVPAS